jgi:dihydroorotase
MKGSETIIRGCRLVRPGFDEPEGPVDLLLRDGRVAAVAQAGALPAAGAEQLEAHGLCAAPGLVDMHVHLRDPGQTEKEDIESGCRAAAAGGVTSLAAMPNTSPAIDTPELVRYEKEKAGRCGGGVRVYPIAAATKGLAGGQPADYGALRAAGAVAFSDDGRPVKDAAMMLAAMRGAAANGSFVISHCEEPSLVHGGIINEGAISRELRVPGVPAAAEELQVAREAVLAGAAGLPVHIAHVSTAASVAIIREAKRLGVRITCETCPHYFSLDETLLRGRDADFRMNPPLRTRADVEAVIAGLKDGTIDAIVTDHAPHTPREKADFEKAPNGAAGLETSLAAGITYLVRPGHLTLGALLRKMSLAPARILGIDAGRLVPGAPADIVLFDPERRWKVEPEKFRSKARNSPFKGRELYGRVEMTLAGGNVIYRASQAD